MLLFKHYLASHSFQAMQNKNRLTFYILVAMVLGAAVGYFIYKDAGNDFRNAFAGNIKLLSTIFLRLVQMIIAPLVFSTLVVGIAKLGDLKSVGRVGGKALIWFITASLVSLMLGMLLVNVFQPGAGINLSLADTSGAAELIGKTQVFSIQNFIEHMFPKSVIEAMASNEILQIVIFAIFFGVATASLDKYSGTIIKGLEAVSHVILKMVNYVMNFAPLGVFGAIAAVMAIKGPAGFYILCALFCLFSFGDRAALGGIDLCWLFNIKEQDARPA